MKIGSAQGLMAFAGAARHGSFAAAARELSVSPSAVAKSIQRLERRLGLRLFHRTTRRVRLTQEGEALYERCRRVLEELGELEASAAGSTASPTGVLRVEAPITYGRRRVIPVLAVLAREYPALEFELRLSDHQADIVGSGLDAVIRIGPIGDSRLVARRIDAQRLGVYGSPGYFDRRRRPRTPAELDGHDCITFRLPSTGRDRPWQFSVEGRHLERQPRRRYRLDEGEALVAAATAGLGLIQVPDYIAEPAVAQGALVEVLARFRPPALPISVVYPTSRLVPPRVRAFVDALRQR